jgi:hypothetical protein
MAGTAVLKFLKPCGRRTAAATDTERHVQGPGATREQAEGPGWESSFGGAAVVIPKRRARPRRRGQCTERGLWPQMVHRPRERAHRRGADQYGIRGHGRSIHRRCSQRRLRSLDAAPSISSPHSIRCSFKPCGRA